MSRCGQFDWWVWFCECVRFIVYRIETLSIVLTSSMPSIIQLVISNFLFGSIIFMCFILPGESILREIFIKTDNFVGGRYFAEIVKVYSMHIM